MMGHFLYQICKINFSILLNHQIFTDNPSVRIYVNQAESSITFRTKRGYYLELLISGMINLLRSNKTKLTKGKSGKKCVYLKITEVVLHH